MKQQNTVIERFTHQCLIIFIK